MGKKRNSKASKGKSKPRRIKCSECGEMVVYKESDIITIGKNKISYVTCDFCGREIILK